MHLISWKCNSFDPGDRATPLSLIEHHVMYSHEVWRSAWSPVNPFTFWLHQDESVIYKCRNECWSTHIVYHGAESCGIYIGLSANNGNQNYTESFMLGIFEERGYGIFVNIRKSQPNYSLQVLQKVCNKPSDPRDIQRQQHQEKP